MNKGGFLTNLRTFENLILKQDALWTFMVLEDPLEPWIPTREIYIKLLFSLK